MNFVGSMTPMSLSEVIFFQKEHKICRGCQIRSINLKKGASYDPDAGVIKVLYKKKEEEEFVRNYQLKEDELYTEVVHHQYRLVYKASFIVHHKPDSENCYNFDTDIEQFQITVFRFI